MIVLFDLDGAVIDDRRNIVECFRETQRAFGLKEWSEKEITELLALPLDKIFSMISPSGEDMVRFYEKQCASKKRGKEILIPGIERVFSFLDEAGVKKGIVTSRSEKMALLTQLGLTFDCVIEGDGVKLKPSGEQIKMFNEDRVIYVGGTQIDEAGVEFIGWGMKRDGEEKHAAQTIEDLISTLKEKLGLRRVIKQGAEAKLYEDSFLGRRCVIKKRIEKSYREKELDRSLRAHRTREEAKLVHEARSLGVNVPKIYDVTEDSIIMEFIEGMRVKEILGDDRALCFEIGRSIGKLHSADIIHGDITTSNMIVRNGVLYLIDFGLGEKSPEIEKKGVDLHVLYEALKAVRKEDLFSAVLKGYGSTYSRAEEVIKRIDVISSRGRYL
ncbi:MAG: KEOPS complex kinase/ATPase Bud32 [Candidatus Thermoplasmatota archaeon]|nr:KEOPS complex kinase/ATPase Bud32 [Candidatus Thermoplasmatota archaeon]